MKYSTDGGQTYQNLAIKALDSMPVGTIVDYDGQVSDIPSGWEQQGNDYSTDEVDTGKTWIDGKKIYRKVLQITTYGSAFNTGITNLGDVVELKTRLLQSNNMWYSLDSANAFLKSDGTQLTVYESASIQKGFAILEYTKTS